MKVAVVGGGVFGAMTALRLEQAGHKVSIFERLPSLMMGASYNNQNRLHLGFHYPRDDETAYQCVRGFERFVKEFESCILSNFKNAYFIASNDSLTTPASFLTFCHRHGLKIRDINLEEFTPKVRHVEMGVLTEEVVYDASLVRENIIDRLKSSDVEIQLGVEVVDISRDFPSGYLISTSVESNRNFDAVVNCSYADINRLTSNLNHKINIQRYEYTALPIIELDLPEPTGITILDGPFMTLLPFGKTNQYLLYHVKHVVIACDEAAFLNRKWLQPDTSPFAGIDKEAWFSTMLESCVRFLPSLREARLAGYLQGPRMVLAKRDDTDARPSIVTEHEPGYITVFSGKIDHCTWVADEIASILATSV